MKIVKLARNSGTQDSNQTQGDLIIIDDSTGQIIYGRPCIERGWRDNQSNVSCVPTGVYPLKLEYSNKFNMDLWELKDVPNRSECKIHSANYWNQLNGCIAPGLKLNDINSDGYLDVISSKAALKEFMDVLGDISETTIEIYDI